MRAFHSLLVQQNHYKVLYRAQQGIFGQPSRSRLIRSQKMAARLLNPLYKNTIQEHYKGTSRHGTCQSKGVRVRTPWSGPICTGSISEQQNNRFLEFTIRRGQDSGRMLRAQAHSQEQFELRAREPPNGQPQQDRPGSTPLGSMPPMRMLSLNLPTPGYCNPSERRGRR